MTADELRSASLEQLLDALAAKTPTPGGGTIAPIVAALAAALAQMVLNYSLGKKSLAVHERSNRAALDRLQATVDSLPQLAADDAAAYGRLNELFKLDSADPRRASQWNQAVAAAIDAPHRTLNESLAILELLESLTATTNRMLASDLAIAAILAEAAARSAAWNVHINLPQLGDAARRNALSAEIARHVALAADRVGRIERACRGDK